MLLKNLLKYRQVWLGIALLWIITYHFPIPLGPFTYIQKLGYGGVDICIFASGVGCFYSLSSESNVVNFMKRRIKRIAPTYVIFILVWLMWQYLMGNFGIQMAIGNILAVQNFTSNGNDFNWYISAIFLFYILAPYFQGIAAKSSPLRKILFLGFLLVFTIPFWGASNYIITITRLPIFYLGMIFADLCQKGKQIDKPTIFCMIGGFILGVLFLWLSVKYASSYRWSHGLYWYPFILLIPPLCFAISYVSVLLEKNKITRLLLKPISLCGDYSFELYLVHVLLFAMIPVIITKYSLINISTIIWGASIPLIPIGAFVLKQMATFANRICARTCFD